MQHDTRWAALLCVPVILVYLNSLAGSFQFDDFNVVVLNPAVHSLAAWWRDLGAGIRPLLKLTYAINWTLGTEAFGFHVVNIAVHLANTVLVFMLASLVVGSYVDRIARHAPIAAMSAALLFALHPVQTEAVTYISGRSSSLMAMFFLGATVSYVVGSLRDQRFQMHVLSPILFALALATKESAICLPFALIAWELSRRHPYSWLRIVHRLCMHWIVLLVAAVGLLIHPVYGERIVPDLDSQSAYVNLLTQIDAISYLVARLAVVYPLNIDPDLRIVTAWTTPLAIKGMLLVTAIALGVWALRRRPWIGFGILWFFVQLAPTNSFLPRLDLANDRQLYLGGVGVFIAIGAEIAVLRHREALVARITRMAMALLLMAFAGLTVLRNRDYATEITLWEQTALVSPEKPRAFNNLGFAYSAAGCLRQAEAAYQEALRLKPEYTIAQDNLARLGERRRLESSRECK